MTGLLLAGCTVGPDYEPPVVNVPVDWSGAIGVGESSDATTQPAELSFAATQPVGEPTTQPGLAMWWDAFDDPALPKLIAMADANNRDLRRAAVRVLEFRYRRGVAAGERLPTLAGTLDYSHQRISGLLDNGGFGGGGGDAGGPGGGGFAFGGEDTSGFDQDLWELGAESSWEIDVFGGIRRNIQAADADVGAAMDDMNAVRVALAADVGQAYVDLCEFVLRLRIAEENAASQQESFELADTRFKAGLVPQLDSSEAFANLQETRSEIPTLRQDVRLAKNRLALLVGGAPGSVDALLTESTRIPVADGDVAAGVPAELLRRRPDLRRAERELAAAVYRIGVATAELYPQFTING
ncbi:MAG: TolC family protein, partial [Planctomycetota bacterium]